MFADPANCINQFDLQSGNCVADLGAGTGELSLAAAQAVGDAGKVYSVEVRKPLLDKLKNRAKEERLHNLWPIWGDIERLQGTHLKDHTVDAAICSNVLFQVEHKEGFVAETSRILRPGGRALVVDWSDSFGGTGPQPEHVVSEKKAKELFEKGGFRFVKKIAAGSHHYGMIFRKT